LEKWLKDKGDAPEWKEILLIEDSEMQHGISIIVPQKALKSPEEYAQRFEELLNRGYDWINLVGNGVLNNKLLVSIEFPKDPKRVPVDKISVNLSGPHIGSNGKLQWYLDDKVKIK